MQLATVLTALLLTAALTCSRNNELIGENQFVTLQYPQTQCADPWPTSASDSTTARNVTRYLDSAGVYVADVTIKANGTGGAVCTACTCPSGKVIYVSTLNTEPMISRLKALKFQ